MNLHGIVRGAVQSVNPDIQAVYFKSAGYFTLASGKRPPKYFAGQNVRVQVQALSGRDLQHPEMLNVQGVLRAVYMYGNTQGVVRTNQQGGDMMLFPQQPGDPPSKWLVVAVLETWPDWSKVAVCLQQ